MNCTSYIPILIGGYPVGQYELFEHLQPGEREARVHGRGDGTDQLLGDDVETPADNRFNKKVHYTITITFFMKNIKVPAIFLPTMKCMVASAKPS